MSIDVEDILDRAMDAAEAELIDTKPAEESDPIEPETHETAPEEVDNPTEQSEPVKKSTRDEKGRFTKAQEKADVKTEISDQEANIEGEETGEVEEPQNTESITPPMFWSAEHRALFAKIPAEAQKVILHYESQRNQWANQKASEAERGKHYEKRANEVFEPYKLQLQANGIKDPFEAANRLLAWNEIFTKEPKAGIRDLMAKNGLTPQDFLDEAESESQYYNSDPRVEQALQEAQEAKRLAEEYQKQLQAQQEQAGIAQIEAFKQGRDESGQPRSQYFEYYKPQIVNAMQEILRARPDISEMAALDHAYEYVIGEARKVLGVNKVSQVSKAPVNVNRAKDAASSIKGAPVSANVTPKPRYKTIEEAMDAAEAELNFR